MPSFLPTLKFMWSTLLVALYLSHNFTFVIQIEGRAASRISTASVHGLQGDDPSGDPLANHGQAVPDSAGLLRQPQPQLYQRRSILVYSVHA